MRDAAANHVRQWKQEQRHQRTKNTKQDHAEGAGNRLSPKGTILGTAKKSACQREKKEYLKHTPEMRRNQSKKKQEQDNKLGWHSHTTNHVRPAGKIPAESSDTTKTTTSP